MKWLMCNMKRTRTWKPCLGFLLAESFTCTEPRSFSLSSAVVCLLNLREQISVWNTTPLNTESTLKHSPSPQAERFLKWRSPISEHGSPGGGHRVAMRLPQSQGPFSAGQQAAPGSPGAGMRLKASWASPLAVHHSTAVKTWLWKLSWMQTKTQCSHSLWGSSMYNKNCVGATSIKLTNITAPHTFSPPLPRCFMLLWPGWKSLSCWVAAAPTRSPLKFGMGGATEQKSNDP